MTTRVPEMSVTQFRVGDDVVHVHTVGSILIMTSGRRLVEVAIAHGDLTLAPPPKKPRWYRRGPRARK